MILDTFWWSYWCHANGWKLWCDFPLPPSKKFAVIPRVMVISSKDFWSSHTIHPTASPSCIQPRHLWLCCKHSWSAFQKWNIESQLQNPKLDWVDPLKTLLTVGLENGFKNITKLLLYASSPEKLPEKWQSFKSLKTYLWKLNMCIETCFNLASC